MGNFIVDCVLQDGTFIEIQTTHFYKLRSKISFLLLHRPVRIVYPLPLEKELLVFDVIKRCLLYKRKSPKHAKLVEAAGELYWLAKLIKHPNLEIELLLTREEEIRCRDGRGSFWRRRISLVDRSLKEVVEKRLLSCRADYAALFLSPRLVQPFTTKELASVFSITSRLAFRVIKVLSELGILELCAKKGRTFLYRTIGSF